MAKETKSKVAAGILAILLGSFGVHKFYLGYTTEGFIYLGAWIASVVIAIVTCGIGVPFVSAVSILALVEGIIYLTKSDEEFEKTYVTSKKAWF